MATIKLHKDYLLNNDLPYSSILDKIIGNSRWSIQHRIVFPYNGKFYETYYQIGATESQYESPWEYDTEVECNEVILTEKTIKVWQKI